ncbi:putative Zn-finger protein [Dioscorea alata]|uniref:Zn-finger protein n=1 Tax=Dioscorea alata TaxID=55571 RepID=A0ACB7WFL6_DIOAL|nr:putative Zn-finger protein [Dioscorea alata]
MEEEEVVVSDPDRSLSFSNSRTVCHVCRKQFSQYTCPRCNSRYCSLQCYKRHSTRCTESFMRENVMEELKQIQPDDETKRKTLDILKRVHLEDEMSFDEVEDVDDVDPMLSEETIQKVLSGNDVRLEDLSPEEIKQFRRAVASGELSKLIQPWTPWWTTPSARTISLSKEGSQLVMPLQEQEDTMLCSSSSAGDDFSQIPAGPENPLPPLCQLSHVEPSPFLSIHLVDILFSYCFTLRFYNGDWHSDALGAATVVLSVSKVLDDEGRPETVAEALGACLEQACSPAYRQAGGFKFGIGLIDDIICLLSLGSNALVCTLCDLQRLIQAGERMFKSEKIGKAKRSESSRKLKSAERKVYFLMCWVHEQPNDVWTSLASIVDVEKTSILSGSRGETVKAGRKRESEPKVLIEEV